jgi:serine/threonine-protein kinase HipA
VGQLHATTGRGKQILTFEYDGAWLDAKRNVYLDPALHHTPGIQYPAAGRESFGAFEDSSPDRWGRVLMQRREAQLVPTT